MRDEFALSALRPPRWLEAERIRFYAGLILTVNIGYFLLRIWFGYIHPIPNVNPPGWDFAVFWSASWLALHGPAANAFDTARIEQIALPLQNVIPSLFVTPWTYPPTFLLVMLPAALLSFPVSCLAYVSAGVACALHVCRRILPPLRGQAWWLPFIASPAFWVTACAGQNSFLTFALMGLGLLCLERRPWLAGILFGLLAIKPQLGVVIPVALLFGRNWRAVISAALTVGVFCALAGLVLGFDTFALFAKALLAFSHLVVQYSDSWPHGISTVFGFARHVGVAVPTAYLLHAVVATLAVSAVAWLWVTRASFELRASALVLATLLVPTYLLSYDLLLLGLPIMWLMQDGTRRGWIRGDGVVMVCAWLSPALFNFPHAWAAGVYAPFIVFAMLLIVVRRYLVQRVARASEHGGIVSIGARSRSR